MGSKSIFYNFVFFLTAIVCSTPFLDRPVLIAALFAMSLVVLILNKSVLLKNRTLILLVILYSLFILLYRVTEISSAAWGRYVIYIYLNIQILMLLLTQSKFLLQKNNMLWWLCLTAMLTNVVWNIFIISIHPEFNEARKYIDEEILKNLNVGSGIFFSFTLMLFMVCFFVYLNCRERKFKRMMLVYSIVISVFIVGFCFKASVVLLWFVSAVLLIFAKTSKNYLALSVILITMVAIGYFIITTYNSEVARFIVSFSPSERLTVRLVGLVSPDDVYAKTSSLESREGLWRLSLDTWLASPINFLFGIGDHWGHLEMGIGQHSEFVDFLAKYGLLGGIIIFIVLKKAFDYIIGLFDSKYRIQLYIIIAIYFACGLTKRVFLPGVNFVVFMFLPFAAKFVNEQKALTNGKVYSLGKKGKTKYRK